ncbi:hypothetical protein Patl1_31986 [Pistacia atlantica]|uniref:Uncharacterized protein n=1 Tax=Pistacia atlantica TaxID=434234 RepID=A0ACC1AN38_9ROSI|nr:hypothetical protein Patl1_31986 [Pistacia atlantica]
MPVQLSEQEKRNSRAERFGTATKTSAPEVSKTSEELKRKARAERFGLPVPTSAGTPSSSLSQVNGQGNIEPKAAIAGNAGGGT